MTSQSWWELIVAVIALVIMTGAALVDATSSLISRHQLRAVGDQRGRARTVGGLLDPRRTLSSSMLAVQAIAIAVAASVLTTLIEREIETGEHILAVVIVSVVFLVFGQIVPRALAAVRPERAIGLLLAFAALLSLLALPVTFLVDRAATWLTGVWPGHPPIVPPEEREDHLRAITDDNGDPEVIEADEREMIDAVLQLEETRARDIMVPRVDIVAVELNTPVSELLARIIEAGHSRLPVYQESIDRIIGVIYAKDLLPSLVADATAPRLLDLLRPAHIVPETKRIDDLLTELRRDRVHMAIVVDEYGGTAGVVTIEDILEEIVGEIQDEYDTELPLFERLSDRELLADGRLPLDEVAATLGIEFAGDDGTVAGFVHRHLGRLPVEGDCFAADGLEIEVVAVEGHRLRQLRFRRPDETAPDPMVALNDQLPFGAPADTLPPKHE